MSMVAARSLKPMSSKSPMMCTAITGVAARSTWKRSGGKAGGGERCVVCES